MIHLCRTTLILFCLSSLARGEEATKDSTEPEPRMFSPADKPDEVLRYRFLAPPVVEKGKKYPLLLCLHGAGERGDDNAKQVGHFKPLFGSAETRAKYPCYVVLPQVPNGELWATYGWSTKRETMEGKPSRSLALAKALVDELVKTEAVDPQRIYVTGLSMGGYGTWEMIQRYPNYFAAAAPVCGGGDLTQAKALTHLPIRAFHGDKDTVIKPEKSGDMIDAIKAADAKADARLTLYKGVGHNSWSPAFRDPDLLKWMFAQERASAAGAAGAARPNVIVIMTDDQGYGEFSCHGNPIARTPHIDKLAVQSVRLTDFHVAPMCTPTRGQLMTGLDAFRNGALNVSSGRTLMRPELKTMADVFKAAGYRTGIFGKWHLGDNHPFRPEDRGFDEAVWFPSSHINAVPDYWDNDYFDDTYIHNGKREKYKGYCTDVFFDEAKKWIAKDADRDKPFFAYIPLNAPHWPFFVPDKYREPVRQAMREKPDVVKGLNDGRREALVSYLAMGANIDENIGKLDAFLAERGLMNSTIVVFLTDNGSTFGEAYFNAGMRGQKTTLWEGGHRVPCFIRWPEGNLGQPRAIDELCHVQDLLPTLADLAGVKEVPAKLDGVSLAPLLRGQKQTLGDRMLVINYSRMPLFKVKYTKGNPAIPQRDGAAVLWKHWRLLENRELYDLRDDPHQDRDVAEKHPEVVAKLRAHLESWWDGVKDTVMEPQRVIIGNDAENPLMLTACEWLDVFVDQQRQIRAGDLKNGVWHLHVAKAGRYTFELRRWPRESDLKLREGAAMVQATDGRFPTGKSYPIVAGRLRVGDQMLESKPQPDGRSVQFEVELKPGPAELQTWFLGGDGKPLLGAYYVYVHRVQ